MLLCFYYNNLQQFDFQAFLYYYVWVLIGGHLTIFVMMRRYILNDFAVIIPALISFNVVSSTIVLIGKNLTEAVLLELEISMALLLGPIFFMIVYDWLSLKLRPHLVALNSRIWILNNIINELRP